MHHAQGDQPPELPGRAALADVIDRVLRETLDDSDPGYWVIRRLVLPFRAEPQLGVSGLMEAFARTLRETVHRVFAGEIVKGVRRYDSRAQWLSECIRAQASDTAAGQWQFARYRELAALPPGDAVRLTLENEPANALAALALLAETGAIRPFCARIGERAARGILRSLLPARGSTGALPDAMLRRFLDEETIATPRAPHRAVLAAIARHAQHRPAAPLPRFDIVKRVAPDALGRPGPLPTLSMPQAPPVAPSAHPRSGNADMVRDMADQQTAAAPDRPGHSPMAGSTTQLETGFAGVFVLWRSVLEMDLLSLFPEGQDGGPARLALAAALAGPDHEAAWDDPALHWLCGYQPTETRAPLPAPDLAARFVAHFAKWRAPRRVEPSLTRVGRLNLLQDRVTEDWLALGDRRTCLAAYRTLDTPASDPPPGMRDPLVDLDWFGVRHRRARRAWVLVARAAYGDFARRLHGLQGSSAAWLWDRLLAGWGTLHTGTPAVMALPGVDLDLVLRMGNVDGTVIETAGGPVRLQLHGSR